NDPVSRADADGHGPPMGPAHDASYRETGGFWALGDPVSTSSLRDPDSEAQQGSTSTGSTQSAASSGQPQATPQPTTGRQPDGSYVAPTGPGSEIARINAAADAGHPVPLVGNGECVALTSKLTGVTDHTPDWTQGPKVVNADGTLNSAVKPGTAIAT